MQAYSNSNLDFVEEQTTSFGRIRFGLFALGSGLLIAAKHLELSPAVSGKKLVRKSGKRTNRSAKDKARPAVP
jgi:hypothetical protein